MKFIPLKISLACMIIIACNSSMNIEQEKENLLAADRNFSRLSVEKGVPFAFDEYMTDDAVIYRDQSPPFEGREQIRNLFAGYPEATLSWVPDKVDLAESGDLGYTLGKWTFSAVTDSGEKHVSYGHYVSIWKKQADGSWKYVFDTGITLPESSE